MAEYNKWYVAGIGSVALVYVVRCGVRWGVGGVGRAAAERGRRMATVRPPIVHNKVIHNTMQEGWQNNGNAHDLDNKRMNRTPER